jgi:streptogramin lyase
MKRARPRSLVVSWRRAFRRVIGLGVIAGALFGATQALALSPILLLPPGITGTAQDRQTLTETPATWDGTYTITWQWNRDGTAIPGATANTYQLTPADIGATITVTETADDGADPTTSADSAPTAVVAAPGNNTRPGISGTAQDRRTLTEVAGVWDSGAYTITRQWKRNGAAIAGATGGTYQLTPADIGATITVTETADGTTTATSAPTAVVAAPGITTRPGISGTAQDRRTLTEVAGVWDSGAYTITRQWNRNGAAIAGQTATTYQLTPADIGATITVTETADGTTTATSGGAVVAAPGITTRPGISGTAQDGRTLTEVAGVWDSGAYTITRQWNRNGAAIVGQTATTYQLTPADVGRTITVTETADGATSATSNPTATVQVAAPTNTNPPAILGIAQQGHTLTESGDTWTGNPSSVTFRWQVCDTTGSACSAIAGATGTSYALTANEVGNTVRVVASATNAGGTTQATSAASSTVVAASAPTPPPVTSSAPSNSAVPTVSGSATVGVTLRESRGQWTNSPTGYADQWVRCDSTGAACVSVSGATGQTYKLTTADVGHAIRVQEIASNASGAGAPVFSTPTAKVSAASSKPTSPKHKPATAAQVKAMLSAQLRPVGATTAPGGDAFAVPFTAIAPGTLVERWYRVPLGAKAAAHATGGKPVLVASGTLKFTRPGNATISVRPTPAGKLVLKATALLVLTAKGTFTASGSKPVRATATTTVVVGRLVPAGRQAGVYRIPTVGAGPSNIVRGSDGGLWFTESGSGRIGHVTPAGKITEYPIGKPKSAPQGLAAGPADDIWFADSGNDSIGRIAHAGAVAEYPIRSDPSAHPTSIAPGPGHTMLYTATGSAKIGSIDTRTHAIREYALPHGFSTPANIVSGSRGLDYFDLYDELGHVLAIGTITAKGKIAVYRFQPHSYVGPYPGSLALGANAIGQTVVFTLDDGNKAVAEYNAVTGARRYFPYPSGSSQGQGLTVATDGTVWYTTKGSGKVTHLNPDTAKTTQYATNPATTEPDGIAQGPLGQIWFLDWQTNAIFRITGGICPVSACDRIR